MYEKRCGKCQSLYRIFEKKVPFHDNDSIQCRICGMELHHWNGEVVCRAELIEPTKPHSNDVHKENKSEECLELLADIAVAKEAEEEYDRQGLEGTISYAEYRAKRLGSESSV